MEIKEDDLIFCKVTGVQDAGIFLEIEGEKRKGTMIMSEVAAGRIRNLREYVSPGRKIVCKVLRISPDHIELSLRRVTTKEREQVIQAYKKERSFANVLEVVGENPEKIIAKIKENYEFADFLEQARADIKLIEKFVGKEKAKKVAEIIAEKESKNKKVLKKFILKTEAENGVTEIRETLETGNAEVHYLGSSIFSLTVSGKDLKDAENNSLRILQEMESKAKKKKMFFENLKEKN